ncbi:MAG: ABC transporter substrate-binding protein [Anaerolineae bacterium]|nr:ABC transporter substrate-binding protein [Anaerolineae bacterium]
MMHKGVLRILGVAGVVGLLLSACATPAPPSPPQEAATPTPPEEATPAPAEENVAVYAMVTSFADIDPSISFSDDLVVTSNAYETLVRYNPPGNAEMLSPGLATSWESNEDGTEWTFHLREGVKFHDGTDFNAEAVKYSIDRTMEMAMGASYIWDPVEEVEVVDDYTARFKLSYAAPVDLIAASGYGSWMMSPTCTEGHDSEWLNEGHDCGSGAYMVESYERGQRLVMTRFDDYWGGWQEGQFHKVVFDIVEEPTVRQQMIEAGEADVTYLLPRENYEALDAREDVTVYTNPSFQNLIGLLNHEKPPLDDPLVRQAISYAFPYDDLITNVMMGAAVQAHGPVPTEMWGSSEDLTQYDYDLDKARELLDQAGYPGGGFDLLMTHATGDLDEAQVGELWKAELAKLGINLEVRAMSWEPQWDLAMSDPMAAQDIFVMYWWPDYVSPYSFLFNMFHCEEEILFNDGYLCDPEFDEMIDRANELSGSDRAEAERLFIEAEQRLIDNADGVFFYDVMNEHVARSDIKGYADNPAYPHVVFFYNLSR